ncbi:flagellin [Terasakiella pusilla]|uniref:flagellin n=1 Tax=Terasakiella pusilla TaxID=64973 RepID=UPI00048C6299|nr:hypothetical protein [Terasakiella pusilla]
MADTPIYLSSAQRSNLFSTQQLNEARTESAYRLSTGRRVNRIYDEPVDYFRAKALIDRVSDLGNVQGSVEVGRSTLQATDIGLEAIEQFSRQLIGIATSAQSTESTTEREALAEQFNEIRAQIDNLASDTSFLGVNLLTTSTARLNTRLGDGDGSTLTSEAGDTRVAALGIGDANADYNGFATLSDITNAIGDVRLAIDTVRSTQADFSTDIAILNVRDGYTEDVRQINQTGADQLTNADLNLEAAVQLSAQIRSDLSFQGQRILAQGDSLLLGLFQ